jgi:hypothetical protein
MIQHKKLRAQGVVDSRKAQTDGGSTTTGLQCNADLSLKPLDIFISINPNYEGITQLAHAKSLGVHSAGVTHTYDEGKQFHCAPHRPFASASSVCSMPSKSTNAPTCNLQAGLTKLQAHCGMPQAVSTRQAQSAAATLRMQAWCSELSPHHTMHDMSSTAMKGKAPRQGPWL